MQAPAGSDMIEYRSAAVSESLKRIFLLLLHHFRKRVQKAEGLSVVFVQVFY